MDTRHSSLPHRDRHPERHDRPERAERPEGPPAEVVQEIPDPGLGTAPQPAPLPDFSVPTHEPFTYEGRTPLSAEDLDVISTFHQQYMQGAGIGSDRAKFRQAKREAAVVLPLMQRQYALACHGVGGTTSQEAQQVQRNVQWVEHLLAMEG